MTIEQFRSTLAQHDANPEWPPALRAMWEDAKGNWNEAHAVAQEIEDKTGSWIHAYLHRKEGDLGNAGSARRPARRDRFPERRMGPDRVKPPWHRGGRPRRQMTLAS